MLSPEQQQAHDAILEWLEGPEREITLGGYAGTGKTHLISHILNAEDAVVLAPTGKAASVLRRKGVPANTIHSHLYNVERRNGDLIFHLKPRGDCWEPFIVVDEASMVSSRLRDDLLERTEKILWVGDHGQLEPIGDNPMLMVDPVLKLETIHRQALDNPIIHYADYLRRGQGPALYPWPDDDRLSFTRAASKVTGYDVVLTSFHRVRTTINDAIREAHGYTDVLHEGETVICLVNRKELGIYNGMTAVVEKIHRKDKWSIDATVLTDSGLRTTVKMSRMQFGSPSLSVGKPARHLTYWDYGYCLTTHKAQGSEWDNVLVVEFPCDGWSMSRWRYTAATRAASSLAWASPQDGGW